MAIDQRLAQRRRVVAEDKARRNVGRLLKLLIMLGVVAVVAWFIFSPYLGVSEVRVSGARASDAHAILAAENLVAGTPMLTIRSGEVEAALETDPWIADAKVSRSWPDLVVVELVERVPVAWVETDAGWARRAIDGVALPSAAEADDSLPWVRFPMMPESTATNDPLLLGALEFVSTLTGEEGRHARVRIDNGGELWARVSGYQIRLGRPVEMSAKALSLTALLRTNPPQDHLLVLIAPTHPASSPLDQKQSDPEKNAKGNDKGNADEDNPASE